MSGADTIGFAGLSHLGIVSSLAAAARGFSVVAFDERSSLVEGLCEGRFPISEPALEETFHRHGERIRYTAAADSLAACRLIFITLDVPTDNNNTSNLEPLRALVEKVAASAQPDAVVVVMSQVPPGFCRQLAGRLRPGLGLFYQVETLIFGNAIERAIRPERYMVGSSDVQDGLPALYRRFLDAFECPVLVMRYESAELCKIAINCFLVASVSTTNMLAEICEQIHADWADIVPALRLDRRIGQYAYLSPGLGIAGGNLERDLATVEKLAAEHGTDARIVTAWKENSSYRKEWVQRLLLDRGLLNGGPDSRVAVWGIAYKAETHSTKNSPALALIRALREYRLRIYDPAVTLNKDDFPQVQVCASAVDAAEAADAVVVMTPWKQFRDVSLAATKQKMRGRAIVDPFGALDAATCRHLGFDYYRLGV
jgi:UDPglucose 6-dehydrogenase